MRPRLRPYEDWFYLYEEALESWDYVVSDKLVYRSDPLKITGDSLSRIPEKYIKGNVWIECHLTFEIDGHADHVLLFISHDGAKERFGRMGKIKPEHITTNGNSPMFVDVTKFVETPKQMRRWINSVVRLKRFDSFCCSCGCSGSVVSECPARSGIAFVKNRELGSFGIRDFEFRELPNGLVKRGSKTVKQVTQDQRYIHGDVCHLYSNFITSGLEIFLVGYLLHSGDPYRLWSASEPTAAHLTRDL